MTRAHIIHTGKHMQKHMFHEWIRVNYFYKDIIIPGLKLQTPTKQKCDINKKLT
jgi:hypothetical protein